jgi:hypothetical protein
MYWRLEKIKWVIPGKDVVVRGAEIKVTRQGRK